MTEAAPETFLGVFLIFCRVGGCLLVVPGFSSARVPQQVRLLIALSVSLALAPLLLPLFRGRIGTLSPSETLLWIFAESVTGLVIGFLARIFLVVLETVVNAAAVMVGLGSMPGTPVEGTDPVPAIEALIMLAASALLFATDLHWELLRGLVESYARIPPGEGIGGQVALVRVVDLAAATFALGLRIVAPFVVYAVIVNLAAGFVNKLTPSIPVYFVVTPLVMFGGLLMLYYLAGEMMMEFLRGYDEWLRKG